MHFDKIPPGKSAQAGGPVPSRWPTKTLGTGRGNVPGYISSEASFVIADEVISDKADFWKRSEIEKSKTNYSLRFLHKVEMTT